MGTTGNWIGQLGGAVGSLFTSEGNAAEANSYTSAASLDEQNAQLTAASTRIQATQEARTVSQSLGTTVADVAGAGFTESGSALAILKSSAQQGALASSLINIQGAINENAYAAEAGANTAKAKAANEANTAGTISAIASIGGALVDGSTQLASAGKTVATGIQKIFSGSGGTDVADTAAEGTQSIGGSVTETDLPALSNTDQAIESGNILNDTSGLPEGLSEDEVGSIIDDADEEVADDAIGDAAGDAIPGVGEVLMAAQLTQLLGIGGTVGSIAGDITGAVGSVVNGVVDAVSDVGSAIGDLFGGSVICTALYKRGKITRRVWNAAQRYGRDIAPSFVYVAYLAWGVPIAKKIDKHKWFAILMYPIFIPWAHELAVLAGEDTAVSTLFGRCVFRLTYLFSNFIGKYLGKRHVNTRA